MRSPRFAIAALLCLRAPSTGAQGTPVDEGDAMRTCSTLAESGQTAAAARLGATAQAGFSRRLTRNPRDVEALVGLARVKSQCLLPSANLLGRGELSSDAIALLDQALELQPDHWLARYVLATIAYRSPAFLGRGPRAAREFDELLRLHGDRTDNPLAATVFALRGEQLAKEGKTAQAVELWRRGSRLFPSDSLLRRLSGTSSPKHDEANAPSPARATNATPSLPNPGPTPSGDSTGAPQARSLSAVRVTARAIAEVPLVSSHRLLTRADLVLTPGGMADPLQVARMQPGATLVGESADLHTRGGDPAETSLMVNGGRVLSLGRFEGLNGAQFGVLDPFVVESMRYRNGGFSARHGNALSGVLEIDLGGRPPERTARAGLSFVQLSGGLQAPFGQRSGGWVSARASHTGALLRMHGRSSEFVGAPASRELAASWIAQPSPVAEFRVTALNAHDDSQRMLTASGWRGPFAATGSTRAMQASTRWVSRHAPLVMRAVTTRSTRSTDWAFGVLSRRREEGRADARLDLEWQPAERWRLQGGLEYASLSRAERGVIPNGSRVDAGSPTLELDGGRSTAAHAGVYSEVELSMSTFAFTAGLRGDRLPGEQRSTFDPRMSGAWRHGPWTARLGGGVFHQGRWRGTAAIPDSGTPGGLALTARHVVVGVDRATHGSLLRVEGFVKRYGDYAPFGSGPSIDALTARGVDALAQRTLGSLTGWLGYSYLDAPARLTTGAVVRSAFDITHSATVSLTAASEHWSLGSTVRYGTGAPVTRTREETSGGARISRAADGVSTRAFAYGPWMNARLPAYSRVDVRLMRHLRTSQALLTSFVEVLNVTGRRNVSGYATGPSGAHASLHAFFAHRTVVMGGELTFR